MQNTEIKKIVQILFFFFPFSALSADNQHDILKTADSLFAEGSYTQALSKYEDLYKSHRVYSNAMLVKMSYIYEGLGDATMALYMLNKYYLRNPDHEVLKKMASLAEKFTIPGYEYKEKNFLLTYYKQYEKEILKVLLVTILTLLSIGIINRIKGQTPSPGFLLFFIFIVSASFLIHLRGIDQQYGIVVRENTFAYEKPAAASKVKMSLPRGSRMVLGMNQDKWYEVIGEDGNRFWVNMYCIQPVY